MPTRIVLRETEAPSQLSPTRSGGFLSGDVPSDEEQAIRRFANAIDRNGVPPSSPLPKHQASRTIVGFRGSIFREIETDAEERKRSLSTTDIRASPRLTGYLFQLLPASVMLISVIQFYRSGDMDIAGKSKSRGSQIQSILTTGKGDSYILKTVNGPVYAWKLIGCVLVGSIGSLVNLICILAHFDTVFFPRLWFTIFHDGSRWEQVLLRCLLVFWACGLHVNTSSLSVGEVQANVFFTTWIAFVAAVVNCGVWRVSAGLHSIAEHITFHYRATTYNWTWTLIFVCIYAGGATDIYFNREFVTIRLQGKVVDLSNLTWIQILSINWGLVFLCLVALALNHFLIHSCQVKLGRHLRFILGWRQIEGIVSLGMVGVFFWFIYSFTGVDEAINGLTNTYYGVWGSFFNSVFTFGTWLRENKDIEYIVRGGTSGPRAQRRWTGR